MTFNVGRWRYRVRWRTRQYAVWCDRVRFQEGIVYRLALGHVQVTVMADCMSASEREALIYAARSTWVERLPL